ncbi:unnamed protein product [Lactuca saligna]|uniref:Uncharacterized protein n=1 Tax=Lactuca saligna TaxID=75948 RepID=A0AA35YGQ7_LACSI|nr:unnamed protein product [Lactuca saligna]
MPSLKVLVVSKVVVAKGVPPSIHPEHMSFNRDRWALTLKVSCPFGYPFVPDGSFCTNASFGRLGATCGGTLVLIRIHGMMFLKQKGLSWFDFSAITNDPMATTYWALRNNRNAVVAEVVLQTHHIADSGGDPDNIDWIAIFENVLGTRRRHDVDVNTFIQNPTFVTTIGDIIHSFKNQVNEENNDAKDDGEDEDN